MATARQTTYIDLGIAQVRPPELFLCSRWFPHNGVACSVLLHIAVTAVVLMASTQPKIVIASASDVIRSSVPVEDGMTLVAPAQVVYRGGLQSAGDQGQGKRPNTALHSTEAAVGERSSPPAIAWDGPVPLVSIPRRPDQNFQTIRRPDLVSPPKLRMPVALPVQVLIAGQFVNPALPPAPERPKPAEAASDLPTRRTDPAEVALRSEDAEPHRNDVAKPVTTATASNPPAAQVAEQLKEKLRPPEPPSAAPPLQPVEIAEVKPQVEAVPEPQRGKIVEPPVSAGAPPQPGPGMLVLNAVAAVHAPNAIPPAETAGKFVVDPENGPGMNALATGRGQDKNIKTPTPAADTVHGDVGNSASKSAKTPDGGDMVVIVRGGPLGSEGKGSSDGHGSGANGNGGAPGSTGPGTLRLSSGSSGGAGSVSHPPVVAVIGAPTIPPASSRSPTLAPKPSYALTIVGAGSAGGGTRDLGIFHNETVYTVYIDLSEDGRRVPGCTLQYAMVAPSEHAGRSDRLTPPFTTSNPYPDLQVDARAKFHGRIIAVYGVIAADGALTNMRVVDSPNPELSSAVLKALAAWVFRPAELNGNALPVKILLGIPIS